MTTATAIEKKVRRAIRNDGGTNLTNADIRKLAEIGLLDLLMKAANEEIMQKWHEQTAPTLSETTGSTSATTEPRRTSGRSRGTTPPSGGCDIEALVAAM